jgi:hypothetical protein
VKRFFCRGGLFTVLYPSGGVSTIKPNCHYGISTIRQFDDVEHDNMTVDIAEVDIKGLFRHTMKILSRDVAQQNRKQSDLFVAFCPTSHDRIF